MKIASNKFADLFNYYSLQLVDIYDKEELYAIFELVCEYYLGFNNAVVAVKFTAAAPAFADIFATSPISPCI